MGEAARDFFGVPAFQRGDEPQVLFHRRQQHVA
jgi:hypothetical protein